MEERLSYCTMPWSMCMTQSRMMECFARVILDGFWGILLLFMDPYLLVWGQFYLKESQLVPPMQASFGRFSKETTSSICTLPPPQLGLSENKILMANSSSKETSPNSNPSPVLVRDATFPLFSGYLKSFPNNSSTIHTGRLSQDHQSCPTSVGLTKDSNQKLDQQLKLYPDTMWESLMKRLVSNAHRMSQESYASSNRCRPLLCYRSSTAISCTSTNISRHFKVTTTLVTVEWLIKTVIFQSCPEWTMLSIQQDTDSPQDKWNKPSCFILKLHRRLWSAQTIKSREKYQSDS